MKTNEKRSIFFSDRCRTTNFLEFCFWLNYHRRFVLLNTDGFFIENHSWMIGRMTFDDDFSGAGRRRVETITSNVKIIAAVHRKRKFLHPMNDVALTFFVWIDHFQFQRVIVPFHSVIEIELKIKIDRRTFFSVENKNQREKNIFLQRTWTWRKTSAVMSLKAPKTESNKTKDERRCGNFLFLETKELFYVCNNKVSNLRHIFGRALDFLWWVIFPSRMKEELLRLHCSTCSINIRPTLLENWKRIFSLSETSNRTNSQFFITDSVPVPGKHHRSAAQRRENRRRQMFRTIFVLSIVSVWFPTEVSWTNRIIISIRRQQKRTERDLQFMTFAFITNASHRPTDELRWITNEPIEPHSLNSFLSCQPTDFIQNFPFFFVFLETNSESFYSQRTELSFVWLKP